MSDRAQDTPTDVPHVESFVLRFTFDPDAAAGDGPGWHGLIRHVQTNTECRFTRFADAVAFIEGRVPVRLDAGSAARDA